MKARPILFSAPMIRALLAGTKTQTRRLVNPKAVEAIEFLGGRCDDQPMTSDDFSIEWAESHEDGPVQKTYPPQWCVRSAEYPEEGIIPVGHAYGNIGDLLWVRETHAPRSDCWGRWQESVLRGFSHFETDQLRYAADHGEHFIDKWRPSIFMPRWASRITLRITDVRVQRLQEISEEDAKAEGVEAVMHKKVHGWTPHVLEYSLLWDRINGTGSWRENPWVWALTFEVIRRNVDQVDVETAADINAARDQGLEAIR